MVFLFQQARRVPQECNPRCFQARHDLFFRLHFFRFPPRSYYPVPASSLFRCASKRSCSGKCSWRNLVLRSRLFDRHPRMGNHFHQRVRIFLHCIVRKSLHPSCQSNLENDERPRCRRSRQRMPHQPRANHGCRIRCLRLLLPRLSLHYLHKAGI